MEMINLMPFEDRRQLAAARTNTLLLRYVILMGMFIAFLAIEMVAVYFIVSAGKANNELVIQENEAKTVEFTDVKQQATLFRSNLATAKYILGKQVPYTTLMLTLANNLPEGAVLEKLSIDPATFDTPTTLSVKTTSYDRAVQVKTALQNAKVNDVPLFSSVSFQSVSNSEGDKTSHPYTAIYNVTYSKKVLTQ
jgi:Tfp pilus assembly protein PilN